ncbi:MAG TPA: hypothetical protein VNM92_13850 [Thermoanaerobaculia bacterium]|nr:hypothetical protein [Thermoanaerobaculia bacterium]
MNWRAGRNSKGHLAFYNAADVVFPQPTASWGVVTHLGIFDALTAGNLLLLVEVTVPKPVNVDDVPNFVAGSLEFSIVIVLP